MKKYRRKRHMVAQPLSEPYRLIPLTRNQNAIVDTADFEWLSQWNWTAQWNRSTKSFYAQRDGGMRIHRVILGCGPDEDGDHKNFNTLDNRRENLRKCSRAQNISNSRLRSNNKSGYKGVCWKKKNNKYQCKIVVNQKHIYLGLFDSAEEAAKAYDAAAVIHHGEFELLNIALHR